MVSLSDGVFQGSRGLCRSDVWGGSKYPRRQMSGGWMGGGKCPMGKYPVTSDLFSLGNLWAEH